MHIIFSKKALIHIVFLMLFSFLLQGDGQESLNTTADAAEEKIALLSQTRSQAT